MGVTVKKCHMIMSGNDCWNSVCFSCHRKADNELADVTLSGNKPPIFGPYLLWPNGWMDQDGIWHGGRPWLRRHCVRWDRSPPKRGTAPQFLSHVYCGQMARWIRMPLGTEVGLGPDDIVLDGAQLSLRGTAPNFRPMSTVVNGRPSQPVLSSCLHSDNYLNRHGPDLNE